MKVIIAGSRDIDGKLGYKLLCDAMKLFRRDVSNDISEIVSGHCGYGVDYLGERYAYSQHMHPTFFPADWNQHGKAAGPIRNREMAAYADALVALWNGTSRGTKNMIEEAKKAGLRVFVFKPVLQRV